MEKNPETRGGGAPALELHDVIYAYASRPRLKILNGVNASFEEGLDGWTRVDFYNGGKVTVEVVEGAGKFAL